MKAGLITKRQAEIATAHAKRLQADYSLTMPPDVAEARAMLEAVRLMQQWSADKRQSTIKQALRQSNLEAEVKADKEGVLIGSGNVMLRLEKRAAAVTQRLIRTVGNTVHDFAAKGLGFTIDLKGARDIIYESFGTVTGNAKAADFSRGFGMANDLAVQWINEGGGMLHKLVDWRVPQRTTREAVLAAGKAKYVARMLEEHNGGHLRLMDFEKSVWFAKGDPGVVDTLSKAYDNLTAISLPPTHSGTSFGGWNETRVFHWTTAEGWLRYNDEFGVGDAGIYDALMGHINTMGRDVATVDVLGNKPQSSVNMLMKMAAGAEAAGEKSKWFGQSGANFIDRMWQTYSGTNNGVGNENVATIMASVRHTLVASKLGGAIAGAVFGDTTTMMFAANHQNVPILRLLGDVFGSLTRSKADKEFARNFEFGSQYLIGRVLESGPHADGTLSAMERATARMADVVIRVQGLKWWTETMKSVYTMNFAHMVGTMVGKTFDELPPVLKTGMADYGIDAAGWDVIRSAQLLDNGKGGKYFDWNAVSDRTLGDKLGAMMLDARSHAIIEPGIQTRAITTGMGKRGTWAGESARAVSQFKSFSLTMAMVHFGTGFLQDGIGSKVKYFGLLGLGLTFAGAATIQAKQILAGKDPRDMSDPKFWGAALVQGGGMGIYGDFLSTAVSSRTGGDVIAAAAGPSVGLLSDATRLLVAPYRELMDSEKTHVGAEVVRFFKANTPGTNLFYSRLMLERGIWDNLQYALDPKAAQSFARQQRKAMKDYGQGYFSQPGGGVIPQRLPDLGAAIGGNR